MAPTNTFLPRIVSVFYAIFHEKHGHRIVYQVPEGLIGTQSRSTTTPSTLSLADFSEPQPAKPNERARSRSATNSPEPSFSSSRSSPRKQPVTSGLSTSGTTLFEFSSISTYVIPPPELCGRLLTISVRSHAILGFPVRVEGLNYKRRFFQYNICFVFDSARSAELAPYEPVVRKVGRVLASCEHESLFLSSPESSKAMRAILEQLYEDLNSYSEASIHLDAFNSLELKVFPFFPNPRPVYDWSVPVPLVDFDKRTDASWDMTIQRVYPHIDGINHVAKIAILSDCDVSLVREAVSHLLYYQTVTLIDIFQFSNVYALRRPLTWLAKSKWVIRECGPYVARPGQQPLEWPALLEMYAHFAGGTSISDWMGHAGQRVDKIDIRRFVSFGVIKGFLRRIHRYPYLLPSASPARSDSNADGGSKISSISKATSIAPSPPVEASTSPTIVMPTTTRRKGSTATDPGLSGRLVERGRRLSAAGETSGRRASLLGRGILTPVPGSPRSAGRQPLVLDDPRIRAIGEERRRLSEHVRATSSPVSPPPSAVADDNTPQETVTEDDDVVPPRDLQFLLDGEHHADALCIRFGVGWPTLERWFDMYGKGRVRIVLR